MTNTATNITPTLIPGQVHICKRVSTAGSVGAL